ncbi:hypothetical protein OAA27_01790 [bacterium]|nr:hypothetical protein [bacterium]
MPAYRYHVSGQAVVTLAGKDFYLGTFDTPESRARYFTLIQDYNENGKAAPDTPTHQKDLPVTVRTVTGEFREWIQERYANDYKERKRREGAALSARLSFLTPRGLDHERLIFRLAGRD